MILKDEKEFVRQKKENGHIRKLIHGKARMVPTLNTETAGNEREGRKGNVIYFKPTKGKVAESRVLSVSFRIWLQI